MAAQGARPATAASTPACCGRRRSSRRATRSSRSPTRSARVVLTKRTPIGWFFGFAIAFALLMLLNVTIGKLLLTGHRHLGQQRPGRLGVRHHQLRLVDRHRPRRHADLGDPAAVPAAVAHVDQPLRRGDDALRRRLRGDVPAAPHRPAVAGGLLAVPVSRTRWACGRSSAARSSGTCSRCRPTARCRRCSGSPGSCPTWRRCATAPQSKVGADDLRHAGARLARLGAALAALRDGVPAAGRHLHAARALGPLGRELRLRGVGAARLARHDLPALLRRRRHLLRLRDGDDAGHAAAEVLRPRRLHHHAAHPQHDEGHAGDRDDRGLRLRQRGVLRLVQRQPVRGLHDAEPHDRARTRSSTGRSSPSTRR